MRRLLADSNFEKEKYHNSNKELRDHIKRAESEKREQGRQIEDAYQKISSKYSMKIMYINNNNMYYIFFYVSGNLDNCIKYQFESVTNIF